MEFIQYGRLSIRRDAVEGLTFEEAKKNNPSVKEKFLLGAWEIANPKGKKKSEADLEKDKLKKKSEAGLEKGKPEQ